MRKLLLAMGFVFGAVSPAYAQWGTTSELATHGIALETSSIRRSDQHAYFSIMFIPREPWQVHGRQTMYEIEKKDLDCLLDKVETLSVVTYAEDGPLETESIARVFWPLSADMRLVRRAVCETGARWIMLPGRPNDVARQLRARSGRPDAPARHP